jgi:hypothetical protein
MELLRAACPRYTDQLSIQRIELSDVSARLRSGVPGFEILIAKRSEILAELNEIPSLFAASPPESASAQGLIGVAYRRPDETGMAFAAPDPIEIDPAKLERANREHAQAQNLLADHLKALGLHLDRRHQRNPTTTCRGKIKPRFSSLR